MNTLVIAMCIMYIILIVFVHCSSGFGDKLGENLADHIKEKHDKRRKEQQTQQTDRAQNQQPLPKQPRVIKKVVKHIDETITTYEEPDSAQNEKHS